MYCGIKLDIKYDDIHVDIYMPIFLIKQLQKYAHPTTKHTKFVPLPPLPHPVRYEIYTQKLRPYDDTNHYIKISIRDSDKLLEGFYITAVQ